MAAASPRPATRSTSAPRERAARRLARTVRPAATRTRAAAEPNRLDSGSRRAGAARPPASPRTATPMTRFIVFVAVLGVCLATAEAHAAASLDCRKRAAAKASSLYGFVSKQFRNCSKTVAAGNACLTAKRDAKVAGKLAKTQ